MQNHSKDSDNDWDLIIQSNQKKSSIRTKELLGYKDLLRLFVKRDFIALYKQTVLGPLWVVIQPILTSITFYVVFSRIAGIGTGGIPQFLFYLIGTTTWTYFADCVVKTSDTFIVNQGIFGKVYFPRLVVPFSLVITNLIKFGIQFGIFIVAYIAFYFFLSTNPEWSLSIHSLMIPVLILIMACLGLGSGLIISSLTTKYRDLRFLIQFGIQLAMYATPIVWPLSLVEPEGQWKMMLNPMTSILETFRVGFFGVDFGVLNYYGVLYSGVFSLIVLFIGLKLFTRVEKSFMDTI